MSYATKAQQLGFPKPGSFCKTGFSVLGKVKTSFGFGSHVIAFTANRRGLQAATLLTELLFTLSRHSKHTFNLPPCLPDIERATTLKILGVTITGKLSMSEHARDVVRKCVQSLHIISAAAA